MWPDVPWEKGSHSGGWAADGVTVRFLPFFSWAVLMYVDVC